jgi:hypothetical protein
MLGMYARGWICLRWVHIPRFLTKTLIDVQQGSLKITIL